MESKGIPGRIQVSRKTYERVYDIFEFDEVKGLEIKPSVVVSTYLLKEKHHDISLMTVSDQSFEAMFSNVNLHSHETYQFLKIVQDTAFINLFKEFVNGTPNCKCSYQG